MNSPADQRREVLITAADWFQRMREEEPTADAITAWLAWRGADPVHDRAYREVQEMWMLAGDAGIEEWPSEQALSDDAYRGEMSVEAWNARQAAAVVAGNGGHQGAREADIESQAAAGQALRPTLRPRRLLLARAAAVLLAVAAVWTTWQPRESAVRAFTTERGITRQLELPDGSIVTLGGASRLRVAYQTDRRELFLDDGEAFFRVHHDRTAPFIVHAYGVAVTAVGTAFNVRADAASTVVAVTEGVVNIDSEHESFTLLPDTVPQRSAHAPLSVQAAPLTESIRARAGEEVTIDSASHVDLQPTTATATLGWMEGSLTFFDEPMSVVVARLNRNDATELVLADPRLGELRFTGTVLKGQVAEWASGLDRVFPMRAVTREDGSVLLIPTEDRRR